MIEIARHLVLLLTLCLVLFGLRFGHAQTSEDTRLAAALAVLDSLPNKTKAKAAQHRKIGISLTVRNEDVFAKEHFEKSLAIYQILLPPTDSVFGHLYADLGSAYRNLGFTFNARYFFSRSEQIYLHYEHISTNAKSLLYNNAGNTFFDAQEFKEAIKYYKLVIGDKKTLDRYIIQAEANLGSAFEHLGQQDSAQIYFDDAFRHFNNRTRSPHIEYTLRLQYGHFLSATKPLLARDQLNKAMVVAIAQQYGPFAYARITQYIARSYLEEGQMDQAYASIQKALDFLDSAYLDISIDDLDHIPSFELHQISEMLLIKAKALKSRFLNTQKIKDLETAFATYQFLLQATDRIRTGPYKNGTKLQFARHFKSLATDALKCAKQLKSVAPNSLIENFVFKAMEKTRHAQVYEKLSKLNEVSRHLIPDSLYEQEVDLILEIEKRNVSLLSANSDSTRNQLSSDIFQLQDKYGRYKKMMGQLYPAYYHGMFGQMSTLEETQKKLHDGEQILEYFWSDSLITILSITPTQYEVVFCPMTSILVEQIKWMQARISTLHHAESQYALYADKTSAIFDQLIAPLLKESTRDLTISADGILSHLPFGALTTNQEPATYRTAPYLMRAINIQYAYSINLSQLDKGILPKSNPSLLAFAFSQQSPALATIPRTSFGELPQSEKEVRRISKFFRTRNVKSLFDREANKQAFLENAHKYDIIHLAVHGVADTSKALSSYIAFKHPTEPDTIEYLSAQEIYGLPLDRVQLTVLSACQTGIGKELIGEGVFSMARAFIFAGSARTVMSLWNVDDISTSQIMAHFYQNMAQGSHIHEALRRSKLTYIEQTKNISDADPYFWAALVPIGNSTPIFLPSNNLYRYVPIEIGVLLAFGLLAFFYFRKKSIHKNR